MKLSGLVEMLMENTEIMDASCYNIRTITVEINLHL
jgi:hypothetical protein